MGVSGRFFDCIPTRMDKKQAASVEWFLRQFYQRATAEDLAESTAGKFDG